MSSVTEIAATSPPPTPAERRRSLAAAFACITVFACGIGLTTPLLSLILDARGTDPVLIGINAAAVFIGVIVGPLLTPAALRRIGLRRFLLVCLIGNGGLLLLLNVFDELAIWFVLRLASGLLGSGMFTATEAWISVLANGPARGRVIGLYATFLSIGFGIGPVLLAWSGVSGWLPFAINSALALVAAVPLLGYGNVERFLDRRIARSPFAVFREAPNIVVAVGLFGLFEAAALSLLPLWGVRIGLSPAEAARCLSALYLGAVFLQYPIGWVSDVVGRDITLSLCALGGVAGAVLIAAMPLAGGFLTTVLFLWGGLAGGLYPVALSMAGDRFRGTDLIAANAGLILAYGIGSLVGPTLGGAALDWWSPVGLPAMFAVVFVAVPVVATLAGRLAAPRLSPPRRPVTAAPGERCTPIPSSPPPEP